MEQAIVLDEYDVVAIPNEGVWIADDDGNAWHVGGPYEHASDGNKLVADYRSAVEETK